LKQEKNSVSLKLEVMKEAKDAVWNGIDATIQRSQEVSPHMRIRRRRIRRQHPFDMFQEQ